ncbi:hypothetical protein PCANC_01912 [Puccinia coronata f. sp. avenae]|uniref:Uncharacterized protein n=3 Tax=Puccinia coronata f. sp. avenae TaxID=200324 RepID=A0A2N5W499_9BASI|nr:hypothetical protein PCANC_01912 [Puccinia coronata f. sp. avenae]
MTDRLDCHHTDSLTHEQDLAVKSFERVLLNFRHHLVQLEGDGSRSEVVSLKIRSHFHRIQTAILPPLPGKLLRMCDLLLNPFFPPDKQVSNYQTGMALVAEVNAIVEDLVAATASFRLLRKTRNDPRRVPDLEECRLCGIAEANIVQLVTKLEQLLHRYSDIISRSSEGNTTRMTMQWAQANRDTHLLRGTIDHTIRWFELLDRRVLHDDWHSMAQRTEGLLSFATDSAKGSPVLRDYLAVIKLSRIFFVKMSRGVFEGNPLSQMCLPELTTLHRATRQIPDEIAMFIREIQRDRPIPGYWEPRVYDVADCFRRPIKILKDFHQRPGVSVDSHLSQESLEDIRDWYELWDCQLIRATTRFARIQHHVDHLISDP